MRTIVRLTFAVAVLLAVPGAGFACSMCHCGDAAFTLVGSQVFVPGAWHAGLDADRFEKDQVSEDLLGAREKEEEDRVTLSLTRTVRKRLTLIARLPFSHRTITTPEESTSLSGLSDPEVLAHYRVRSFGPGSWISISLGLRTGWGENTRERDGERAEEHLQPGTGAAGVESGLSFARVVGTGDNASLFGSFSGRVNARNDAGYRYGRAMLANLGYERKLGSRLNAIAEANFRMAAKDEPQVGESDLNTGGTVLYASPHLLLKIQDTLFLRLGVQVPLVKHLYGDQDEKVNVLSGLTVRF